MTNKEKHQERFMQKLRFKKRVKKLHYFNYRFNSPRLEGIVYHTRKLCSCPMCGNPRKYFGEQTVQEQSHLEAYRLWKKYQE